MWVNSADDFINPRELGIAEKDVALIPHAKLELIPISDQPRGHAHPGVRVEGLSGRIAEGDGALAAGRLRAAFCSGGGNGLGSALAGLGVAASLVSLACVYEAGAHDQAPVIMVRPPN